MNRLNQTIGRFFSLPRWSLLGLGALAPIMFLVLLLLSASMVAAEPSSPTDNNIVGFVVEPGGSAIGEATEICLRYLNPPESDEDWHVCPETEADGSFSFTETIPIHYLPGEFEMRAEAPGDSMYYASMPMHVHIENDGELIDIGPITLTHASLEGIVYEPGGTMPAQWGWVEALAWPLEEWETVAASGYNELGAYAIGGMPNGQFWLVADPPYDSMLWRSEPISINVNGGQYNPGAEIIQDLELRDPNVHGVVVYPDGANAGWIVSGTVLLPENIIGEAKIKAVSFDDMMHQEHHTNPAGDFVLLLPPGDYNVWAVPQGEMGLGHTRSIPRHVPVGPGAPMAETGPMTLTFPSFMGEVFDPMGDPVPDCLSVWLEDMMGNWVVDYWYCPEGPMNLRAPQQGAPYKLGGIPSGDYWLRADGLPEFGLLPPEPIFVYVPPNSQYDPAATMWFDLQLESSAGPLTVFVDKPDGDPVPAHVTLKDESGFEEWHMSHPGDPAQFMGLEPGEYMVQAWPTDPDIPTLANSEPVWLLVEEPMTVTLELRIPNVTGTIVAPGGGPLPPAHNEQGDPVYPAEISFHNADWSIDEWGIMTNMAGEFSLALPHDYYALEGYPFASLNISYTRSLPVEFWTPDPGDPPLDLGDIPLTRPRVWGWVLDPNDEPVSTGVDIWNATGTYQDWDDTWAGDPMNPGEPFRFGGLPAGHYFVQAQPPWDNPWGLGVSNIEDFIVPPHTSQQITLHLGMANFIGDLHLPPDSGCPECPVPWADVRLRDEAWTFEEQTTTGADGRFTFSGLESGVPYVVEVIHLPEEFRFDWAHRLQSISPWPRPKTRLNTCSTCGRPCTTSACLER